MNFILEQLKQGQVLLAMDRDGTLVPYADRPENAPVAPALLETLKRLERIDGITMAVVSARSNALLKSDFGALKIILAGNYGMEIAFPGEEPVVQEEARETVPLMQEVRNFLAPLAEPGIGAIVEDHGLSVCLHWHTVVGSQNLELVHSEIARLHALLPNLRCHRLPTSYEILPQINWNKGSALAAIDAMLPAQKRSYVFIGDTDADEPAFAWVNQRGGMSLRVGVNPDYSCAKTRASDPFEVHELLSCLAEQAQN